MLTVRSAEKPCENNCYGNGRKPPGVGRVVFVLTPFDKIQNRKNVVTVARKLGTGPARAGRRDCTPHGFAVCPCARARVCGGMHMCTCGVPCPNHRRVARGVRVRSSVRMPRPLDSRHTRRRIAFAALGVAVPMPPGSAVPT